VDAIRLGDLTVSDGHPCYFVAEIGGLFKNFDEAKRLINSAVEIGINAVKFQTLEADTITTKNNFFDLGVTGHISQYDFFKKFEPSKELQKQVIKYANDCGITVFSAPSHIKDVEFMEGIDVPIYKIGSDLACHIPLLKKVGHLGKPIILSTGMTTLEEVRDSVNAIFETGNKKLILLHCVSDYPTKIEETNLSAINTLKKEFDVPIGYSDHTVGINTTFAAAIFGANLIEKHFRHSSNEKSPDDIHALNSEQFLELINNVRDFEKSRGSGKKIPSSAEKVNLVSNRVSIVSLVGIQKDDVITSEMIDVRRPGTGLAPKYFDSLIGKKALVDIPKDSPIKKEMVLWK
tara:strand:+ start:43 stop:1083 length:1041 start_codon:yes stop_codon:yes gene_type:complete